MGFRLPHPAPIFLIVCRLLKARLTLQLCYSIPGNRLRSSVGLEQETSKLKVAGSNPAGGTKMNHLSQIVMFRSVA
jgi:hypothetical protein